MRRSSERSKLVSSSSSSPPRWDRCGWRKRSACASLAEANNRTAELVLLEEFSPDQLLSYDADAFVSTACPRIAIDDYLRYPKPILTPIEMEIALGLKQWSDYRLDCILG